MRGSMRLDGVGGGKRRVMGLRGLVLISRVRGSREVGLLVTVVVVTVMVVVGGIGILVGTGVVSVAEADRESIEGGELSVL